MARPGSTAMVGMGSPSAADSRSTIAASVSATFCTGSGRSSGRYEIPSPPPRSTTDICAVFSTPNSPTTSRSSPSTRWAASSNPSMSKICDPMWLCRPTSLRLSVAKTRRMASIAIPPASENPNFWSSCAVEMNSWVCASTPTVTRTSTSATTPRSPAITSSRSISIIESRTTCPIPASTAARSSSTLLLLPCNAIRSGGKPARSAMASSPPLQTSRDSPSSSTQRAISVLRNAFDA